MENLLTDLNSIDNETGLFQGITAYHTNDIELLRGILSTDPKEIKDFLDQHTENPDDLLDVFVVIRDRVLKDSGLTIENLIKKQEALERLVAQEISGRQKERAEVQKLDTDSHLT